MAEPTLGGGGQHANVIVNESKPVIRGVVSEKSTRDQSIIEPTNEWCARGIFHSGSRYMGGTSMYLYRNAS